MRIKEYGHIKPQEIKCNHCGAILEVVPEDLYLSRIFEGSSHYGYVFRCAVCNGVVERDNKGRRLHK